MVVGTVANVVVEAVTVGSVDDACSDDGNVVVEGVLETVCFVGSVDVGFISSVDGSVDDAVEAVSARVSFIGSDDGNVVVEGVSETVCFVGSVDVGFISSVDGSVDDAVEAVANVVEELDEVSSVNLVFLDDLKTF